LLSSKNRAGHYAPKSTDARSHRPSNPPVARFRMAFFPLPSDGSCLARIKLSVI
jgi:hypothetical protein